MINVKKPELILNKEACLSNIQRMADKASRHNLVFRPHFKTHQSRTIGHWFRNCGVNAITVSSVKMAKYFAGDGWNDITIAIPVNRLQIREINDIASKIELNLVVISHDTLDFLSRNLSSPVGVFIEIDNGYNRTGLTTDETKLIDSLILGFLKCPLITFRGFLVHAGNTYNAVGINQIGQIHRNTIEILLNIKNRYRNEFENVAISIGDTPSCSLMKDFEGVDEIRPGNFVFYDIMQEQIGSCKFSDIATALAVPVLALNESRNEILVEGGAIHLSKEYITGDNGNVLFGYPVLFTADGWTEPDRASYVRSATQEHGVIAATHEFFNCVSTGDVIGILPVHSCLTAHQMRRYITLSNEIISTMNS